MDDVNSTTLRKFAYNAIADYRVRTGARIAPLVYRSVSDHAVLAILAAAHDLEHEIRATPTVDTAMTLRRQMAAILDRVDQLETLALARATELCEKGTPCR